MLALTQPGVTVDAITTVTGNVHVSKVIPNVFTVLDIMRRDIPVFRGAEHPLVAGFWEPEAGVHGADGLGDMPDRVLLQRPPAPGPAAVELVRLADEAPGELTLVALGPLTNIALACHLDPAFPAKIKQFVFMGGTIFATGNTKNVTAEFNVWCDPEAAHIVLSAFPTATMLSWETTMQHPFSWEQYDALAAMNSDAARFFKATTAGLVSKLRGLFGFLLPDPLAMAIALEPGLIEQYESYYVTVELGGLHTRGQTVIDRSGTLKRPPNVQIVTRVNMGGVYAMYEQALA